MNQQILNIMTNSMYSVLTYLAYLGCTIPLIAWVGNTLYKNGRVFILDIFKKDEQLTDAINKLLLVGFYLINIGYTVYALQIMGEIENAKQMIEILSKKVGLITLVLGMMHFANMFALYKLRKRAIYWANSYE